jgi:hypothetical protein
MAEKLRQAASHGLGAVRQAVEPHYTGAQARLILSVDVDSAIV